MGPLEESLLKTGRKPEPERDSNEGFVQAKLRTQTHRRLMLLLARLSEQTHKSNSGRLKKAPNGWNPARLPGSVSDVIDYLLFKLDKEAARQAAYDRKARRKAAADVADGPPAR